MSDTWTRITNPGTRSCKSLSNINVFLRHLSLYNRWKTPSGTKAHNCIHTEALNNIVVNNFLFIIDTQKIRIETKAIYSC